MYTLSGGYIINVREHRTAIRWTIQRNWQQWVHKTQDANHYTQKKNTIEDMGPPTNNWKQRRTEHRMSLCYI